MSIGGSLLPHGGGLINRFVREFEAESFLKKAKNFKPYTITAGDLAIFYRIADGTLSPIEGPMDREEFDRVLGEECVIRGGKKYSWTIPMVFPIAKKDADSLRVGDTVAVRIANHTIVGSLEITDIYPFDKAHYNKVVYGTDRIDHPGPRIALEDERDYLLGGVIWALPYVPNVSFGTHLYSPLRSREIFKAKGWQRIVAFQTRNPLHRAHEYAMVYALEKLTKEGCNTGVVLNPLVGETKSDDVPAAVRMKTYEALINNRTLGKGDMDEDFWKSRGRRFHDHLMLMALDMKMFYAGPKEAVMHAIYRQNTGFTDIIIGRKHADAPFADGTPAWGDFDAQEKFKHLNGELLVKPFPVGQAAFFQELGRVGLIDHCKDAKYTEIAISGKELRKKLELGERVDERIMRKEVADILSEAYKSNIGGLRQDIKSGNIVWHASAVTKADREKRNKHRGVCLWLTGLSCSGKSTIANGVQQVLFEKGAHVYILDGDNIRHGLNRDLGFSPEDRKENIRRIGEVAKLFSESGAIVLVAFISPYREDRDSARSLFTKGDFAEIYIKADLLTCEQRDTKGLYKKARLGEIKEFTGISAPYEEPLSPELVVNTMHGKPEASVQEIMRYLTANKYVSLAV